MAKQAAIPATVWVANASSPQADQNNQDGNRDTPSGAGLTVVNFAQVDVSWDVSATTMTLVERAEAEVGPYVTEGWDEPGVSSRRLNNHMPSTTYWYRIRRVGVGGSVTETVNLGSATTPAATREIYVSTTGNDANDGLTLGNAFRNINKWHSVAAAGDICYIKAGTYQEDAEAYNTANSAGMTIQDTGVGSCMMQSQLDGTEASPIVMRAYPGDETLVILDGQADTATFDGAGQLTDIGSAVRGVRIHNNHWHLYGLEITNQLTCCVGCNVNAASSAYETVAIDPLLQPSDVVIENCRLHDVNEFSGGNSAPVWPWGGNRWTIRNLRIDNSYQAAGTRGNGIQWYGALDMRIENVKITNAEQAVQMKDHYILTASPRTTGLEATIKACDFDARQNGISVNQRGATSNEAGQVIVRYSLLKGNESGVLWNPSANTTADRQSDQIEVYHCTLHGRNNRDIFVRNSSGAELFGNAFVTGDVRFSHPTWDGSTWETRLDVSNYNAFNSTTFDFTVDDTSPQESSSSTLAAWQAKTNDGYTLTFDSPDPNSASAATVVTNSGTGDYSIPATSSAYQLLSDGSDAGCTRFGEEIIGLLPTFYWGDI